MAKFSVDRKRPPKLTAGQAARLDAMSDEESLRQRGPTPTIRR